MKINLRLFLIVFVVCSFVFISANKKNYASYAPVGYTGAQTKTCTSCHSGTNNLNASGGSVVINNLPATYTPGTKYNFTVTIKHASANRYSWGFAVKAVATSSTTTVAGTFSTTNPNTAIASNELGHSNAPTTGASNTYTFSNLSWTAPTNPTTAQQNITFYVVGNAANGIGDGGDFIYSATQKIGRAHV